MPGKPQEKHAIDEPFSMSDLGRVTLKKAWGHFCTITHHKLLVMRYCFRVGLYRQGLAHDLSKYSPCEFMVGVRYYQGFRSPNSAERAIKGYSEAWMHHKGRNKHHFEYWSDYNPRSHTVEPVKMPVRYVAEMFCDRVAASRIYQGSDYRPEHPLEYYLRGKSRRVIHPDTAALLESWLRLLAEEGEAAAFAAVRQEVQAARRGVSTYGDYK